LIAGVLAPDGAEAPVTVIPFVRFRGLVRPADRLEVEAKPREEGGVRFEVRRGTALVANGAMVFGLPRPADGGATAVASRALRGAPPIHELIPHRSPMLFVERLLGEADDGATCVGSVPPACALVAAGVTPAFVALEVAAQTAAVWEALRRSRAAGRAEPRMGYLVSIKDALLHRATIPADVELIASIRLVAEAAPLTTYAVEVVVEGGLALSGTIGTFLSD
jgi:predicted hotdog family 3-hydroxylacyl-ACP dehydratase